MAEFDPYANQGGPAAWDPQHRDDSRELADRLLREVDADAVAKDVEDAGRTNEPPAAAPHVTPEFTD